MVADDDPSVRALVALHVQRLACDVLEAEDGEAALRLTLEHEPDLLVVDERMPLLSGSEVTREVRRLLPGHLRVLLISGSVLSSDISFTFEVGANAYLKKPFSGEELIARVQALLSPVADRDDRT